MKKNIAIKLSTGDILANNGFAAEKDRFCLGDVSIKMGKTLEISKDCFSSTPLFYAVAGDCFYASTNWLDLESSIREKNLFLNLDYVYDYIQFQCPRTAATMCDKIFYLRGGETLTVDEKGVPSTYFTPPAASAAVLLEDTLKDTLSSLDNKNTVYHISSGLDSSILTILAAGIHTAPLKLVTCKTRGKGAADELANVERLAERLKAGLKIYDFTNIDIFKEGIFLNDALGYPTGHPSHLIEFLLEKENRDKKYVVTGKGPDEVLAGYEWHKEEYSPAQAHFQRVCVTPPGFLDELLLNFSARGERYSFWEKQSTLSLRDRLLYDLQSISPAWEIIHSAIGTYFDICITSPFMNKQLRNTLFFLDDNLKIRNNIHKWYLRETFRDLYPDYILNFPKQGLRLDLQPYLRDFSFSELYHMLYKTAEFSQKYINETLLKKMIEETLNGKKNWGWQTWNIYLCSLFYAKLMYTRYT
ncbi:MAG: asparagine synthase [Candidatus Aminicenantes bacterium]|nr:asparagine synthase [Candidatus Aminicenantes bacterium]